ncbi:MAG: hemerythrin family protein [Chromatiales bacterium]|nr:hemerythrin family protein [Chromatiales bacterium]
MSDEEDDMSVIAMEDVPRVAHAHMQAVHASEVEVLDALGEAIDAHRAGDATATIDAALGVLLEHVEAHFEGENRMMEAAGFPALPVHVGEHRRVLARLQEVLADWRSTRDVSALANYFFDEHMDWMMQHISTMDFVTAQFLSMRGVTAP